MRYLIRPHLQRLRRLFTLPFMALVFLSVTSLSALAAIEAHEFSNETERQRYQSFIEEMRCPKCQNQNLAGSDSPIAADLRRELYQMIKAEKSDKEIVDYMVSRYGDFILYRPRITPVTYVLWIAPIALLIIGVIVLLLMLRERRRMELTTVEQGLSAEEASRLANLLKQHPPTANSLTTNNNETAPNSQEIRS